MNYYLINYKLNGIGESGESCGSEFDFDGACETCGTGARLNSPLKVKGISKTKKHLFATQNEDLIISNELYSKIKSEIPSFKIEHVINTKGEKLDYFHLAAKMTLAPFGTESSGYVIEDQCPSCKRNGYFNDIILGDLDKQIPTIIKPLSFVYPVEYINNLEESDVLETWERVGLSNLKAHSNNVVRFARPWMIISEYLKSILEFANVTNIEFQSIVLKEENTEYNIV
jgi:hypothetical protein